MCTRNLTLPFVFEIMEHKHELPQWKLPNHTILQRRKDTSLYIYFYDKESMVSHLNAKTTGNGVIEAQY